MARSIFKPFVIGSLSIFSPILPLILSRFSFSLNHSNRISSSSIRLSTAKGRESVRVQGAESCGVLLDCDVATAHGCGGLGRCWLGVRHLLLAVSVGRGASSSVVSASEVLVAMRKGARVAILAVTVREILAERNLVVSALLLALSRTSLPVALVITIGCSTGASVHATTAAAIASAASSTRGEVG